MVQDAIALGRAGGEQTIKQDTGVAASTEDQALNTALA